MDINVGSVFHQFQRMRLKGLKPIMLKSMSLCLAVALSSQPVFAEENGSFKPKSLDYSVSSVSDDAVTFWLSYKAASKSVKPTHTQMAGLCFLHATQLGSKLAKKHGFFPYSVQQTERKIKIRISDKESSCSAYYVVKQHQE